MTRIHFDQAIPAALALLGPFLNAANGTTLMRDSFGALTVVMHDDAMATAAEWDALAQALHQALGAYSLGESRVLLRSSDLIDAADVLESPDRIRWPDAPHVWLLDRLLTNQDWLRKPLVAQPPLPTAVAFSIKGGVGRTTAFALWAWSLARAGKNVVLVDLDLEAPGVAGLLIDKTRLPDYGLVDWLVESLVGQGDAALLRDCLVDCDLARPETGTIRVLPAFGSKTRDYVNKLGRIYMPSFSPESGQFSGLADRLLALLQQLATLPDAPDLVLLDSRAGLHDIGAAAVTRLGAEVFLFARDDDQSWQAYGQLFEHLSKSRSVAVGMEDDDLRWRLKMVGAQLVPTEAAQRRFTDTCYSVWSETLYDTGVRFEDEEVLKDNHQPVPVSFELADDNAPHGPLVVHFDASVKGFDLTDIENRPDWRVIESAFGGFFANATARLFP